MSEIDPPEPGKTSVRMGKAFLRPSEEKGHYELMRPVITVINEGGRVSTQAHDQPIGPLAVYRRRGKGDKMPEVPSTGPTPTIMTSDPITKKPMELILVWWAGAEKKEDDE